MIRRTDVRNADPLRATATSVSRCATTHRRGAGDAGSRSRSPPRVRREYIFFTIPRFRGTAPGPGPCRFTTRDRAMFLSFIFFFSPTNAAGDRVTGVFEFFLFLSRRRPSIRRDARARHPTPSRTDRPGIVCSDDDLRTSRYRLRARPPSVSRRTGDGRVVYTFFFHRAPIGRGADSRPPPDVWRPTGDGSFRIFFFLSRRHAPIRDAGVGYKIPSRAFYAAGRLNRLFAASILPITITRQPLDQSRRT